MPLIGVTGGFATGKSLVSSMFVKMGAHLLDCDELARKVVKPPSKGFLSVVETFGEGILAKDGTIDRKKLGKTVFNNADKRRKLETILHPLILEKLTFQAEEIISEDSNAVIVVEAALLFESGLFKRMDFKVTVTCDEAQQVKRAKKRDGISEGDTKAIINSQWALARKVDLADFVIDNSGGIEATRQQVETIFKQAAPKL